MGNNIIILCSLFVVLIALIFRVLWQKEQDEIDEITSENLEKLESAITEYEHKKIRNDECKKKKQINIPKQYTEKTNCPNCGAVITGDKCEYCGTVFNRKHDYDEVFTARDSSGNIVTQYIGNVCREPEE